MSLEQKIAAFLAQADAKPTPSKLEPYADLIRTLRQRRWTYKQIAAALKDRFSVSAAASTVHNFLKVRAKRKGVLLMSTPEVPILATGAKRPRFNLDA
jgi:hypothetical protein